jgi:hypothetical protein
MDNINNIFDDINMSYDLIKLYNSYFLNSTDMISFSNENFKQLLINYSKYLFKISILHNNIYLEHIFDKGKPRTETTVNPIYEIYNNMKNLMRFNVYITDEIRDKIDAPILRLYYELLIKSVFVIFQYYYLYNKLGKEIILLSKSSSVPLSFDLLLQNYKIKLTKQKAEEDLPKYDSEQKLYSIAQTILEKNNKKVNNEIAKFIEEEVNKIIQESLKFDKFTFTQIKTIIFNYREYEDIYTIDNLTEEQSYILFILKKIKYLLTNSKQYYDIRSHDIKKDTLILKYTILYSIIIIEFNKLFYNINESNYMTDPLQFHIKYDKLTELLLNDEKSFLNDLKELLFNFLTQLYKINKPTTIIDKNTYITIPQYEGICWFISFLTALTYSDRNKQLLINKYDEIKSSVLDDMDKITSKTDYITIFNTLVYYIINNVTKDFRTYKVDDMQSDCKLFDNFKKYPILFLKKLINDMNNFYKDLVIEKIKKSEKKIERVLSLVSLKYENELIRYYKNKLSTNVTNIHNYIFYSILNKEYGIMPMHYSILKMFYSFLNINCLYVYKIQDKYFKIKDPVKTHYNIIIIDNTINNFNNYNLDDNIIEDTIDVTGEILYQKDSIIYNKNKYELDYLLHGSDNYKTSSHIGHVISAIHYNDEEYYHDSDNILYLQECKKHENDIYIPCSLIKEKWKNKIDTNTCYKLEKCGYNIEHKDTTIDPTINHIIKNSIYQNICFTKDTSYITCYVKV